MQTLRPKQRAILLASLPEDVAQVLAFDWEIWARDKQLAPPGAWSTWVALAGRGFGKTRLGAEWIRQRVAAGARRIALVGATAADVRDVMVEGTSGILAVSPSWERPRYEPSKRRLTWPGGCVGTTFSADEPNRLRGPQFDTAWCDELAAWRYLEEAWDMLAFGLRLGDPRCLVTTTPRPVRVLRDLLADPTTVAVRGSTYENRANLAQAFIRKVEAKYEGTRLGRQELHAEVLEDTPGALWTLGQIDKHRVARAPAMQRVVVAIDPAVSTGEGSAETGIVAAGLGEDGHGYVLADRSGEYTPDGWGRESVALYRLQKADRIVAEANQGGDLVESNLRTVDTSVPITLVHASRGKRTRAEPVSALYEQGKVHHVGSLAKLEDQMVTWDGSGASPDRMDALVWALTALMLGEQSFVGQVEDNWMDR